VRARIVDRSTGPDVMRCWSPQVIRKSDSRTHSLQITRRDRIVFDLVFVATAVVYAVIVVASLIVAVRSDTRTPTKPPAGSATSPLSSTTPGGPALAGRGRARPPRPP
jgi:hypothetical protein